MFGGHLQANPKGYNNMNKKTRQNDLIIIMIIMMLVIGAAIMIAAVVIGITKNGGQEEVIHPVGQTTEEPRTLEGVPIIFVPAYEKCPPEDRVLLDNPIEITNLDGNVVYHWMYECKDTAWNRSHTTPDCTQDLSTRETS
jgi:hypothetical protein